MAHLIRNRLCETGYKAGPSKRGAILVVSNLVAAVRNVSKRSGRQDNYSAYTIHSQERQELSREMSVKNSLFGSYVPRQDLLARYELVPLSE